VTGVGIAGSLSNVTNLIGNSINTLLQGVNAGQTFVITADNEITVDGTQVFKGVGSLAAGTGVDIISGSAPFKAAGNISDAGGATTLSGTIRTDGSQTYLGDVTAPAVTLVALGGLTATNPANNFGAVSLTGARSTCATSTRSTCSPSRSGQAGHGDQLGQRGHAARRRHHQRRPDLDR
jgi:hypothetical protein